MGKKLKCYTGSILFKCSSKHCETEAAKWNPANIHVIIYTSVRLLQRKKNKNLMDNEHYNG